MTPVQFFRLGPSEYGYDINNDGRITRTADDPLYGETFEASPAELTQKARDFMARAGGPVDDMEVSVSEKSIEEGFSPTDESRLRVTHMLSNDIKRLEAMKNKPLIYQQLEIDLKLMKQASGQVHFVEADPPNGFMPGDNFQPHLNQLGIRPSTPDALIIHELDHKLTHHHRVKSFSDTYFVRTVDGLLQVNDHFFPKPEQAQTRFEVRLPFPKNEHIVLQYNGVTDSLLMGAGISLPLKRYERNAEGRLQLPDETNLCHDKAGEIESNHLADEVQGYITMGSYVAFRTGLTEADIGRITNGNPQAIKDMENRVWVHMLKLSKEDMKRPEWQQFLDLTENDKLKFMSMELAEVRHLDSQSLVFFEEFDHRLKEVSSIRPGWVNNMMKAFFGVHPEGLRLDKYIKKSYTEMHVQTFTNKPGCLKLEESANYPLWQGRGGTFPASHTHGKSHPVTR